jgi:hypothetical protein
MSIEIKTKASGKNKRGRPRKILTPEEMKVKEDKEERKKVKKIKIILTPEEKKEKVRIANQNNKQSRYKWQKKINKCPICDVFYSNQYKPRHLISPVHTSCLRVIEKTKQQIKSMI